MIFFADGAGIRQGDNPPGSLARTGRDMIELEPTMLLPALAMVTSRIGLVTTASTTYNEPYNLARRFANPGSDQQGARSMKLRGPGLRGHLPEIDRLRGNAWQESRESLHVRLVGAHRRAETDRACSAI